MGEMVMFFGGMTVVWGAMDFMGESGSTAKLKKFAAKAAGGFAIVGVGFVLKVIGI